MLRAVSTVPRSAPAAPSSSASAATSDETGAEFPWRLVFENTIVGISYMLDRRFLWANPRMAEIFGYAPGELDGEPVRRLYASQEDYEEVGRLIGGFPHDGFYTHERAMVCKDGSLLWCRISGRLIRRDDPRSPSVWVVQDLSDKKRAEDELRRVNQQLEQTVARRTTNLRRSNEALKAEIERRRELQAVSLASREKYRALFRYMPLGVLVADADGAIAEVNRTLQGYLGASTRARLDALMADETRAMLPDGQTCSIAALVRHHTTGDHQRVERFEIGWLAGNGRRREMAVIVAPLAAQRRGVVFTFADVTEQRQRREREHEQQAALTHASRLSLMGQMASALAHELGQPLNACQSYLSGMRHRLDDSLADHPELKQALDKASAHLEQAGQIIRNVRGFVARHRPEFEPVALPGLLAQTLSLLELPISTGGVHVSVQIDVAPGEVLPAARCHPVEIQQVLVNLLINAVDALEGVAPGARQIQVRLALDARGMLQVEVGDSGPGVPAELAPRLFDPYVTSKSAGLGMGLMICRTIVESHGGSLRHVPQRGGGALFRFTLPVWDES